MESNVALGKVALACLAAGLVLPLATFVVAGVVAGPVVLLYADNPWFAATLTAMLCMVLQFVGIGYLVWANFIRPKPPLLPSSRGPIPVPPGTPGNPHHP